RPTTWTPAPSTSSTPSPTLASPRGLEMALERAAGLGGGSSPDSSPRRDIRSPCSRPSHHTRRELNMYAFVSILLIGASPGQPASGPGEADEDIGARLERPAYDPQGTTKAIDFWRKRVERDGGVALGWTELARACLARHHQTGSLDDAVQAECA